MKWVPPLRRELFYWAVIPSTFTMGTTAGNLTVVDPGLEYKKSP
ncbi:MAG: hypothetical protein M0T70_16610 [Geobacteraceae bacterium]|nr:hypothetical protein [Geobacteraceae bacterium]